MVVYGAQNSMERKRSAKLFREPSSRPYKKTRQTIGSDDKAGEVAVHDYEKESKDTDVFPGKELRLPY